MRSFEFGLFVVPSSWSVDLPGEGFVDVFVEEINRVLSLGVVSKLFNDLQVLGTFIISWIPVVSCDLVRNAFECRIGIEEILPYWLIGGCDEIREVAGGVESS